MIKSSLNCQSQLTSDSAFIKTYLRLALLSSSTDQSRSNTGSATSPYSSLLVYSESLISVPISSSIASMFLRVTSRVQKGMRSVRYLYSVYVPHRLGIVA